MAQHKYHPCWGAHIGYMQTYVWELAVERAKSFYPVDVIKTLEVSKSDLFNSTLGKMWYDADNRQMVRPVPVVVGKVPGKMQIPDDFYEVLEVVPGARPECSAAISGLYLT